MSENPTRACASCGATDVALHEDTHPETADGQWLCDKCEDAVTFLLGYPPEARRHVMDWIRSDRFPELPE